MKLSNAGLEFIKQFEGFVASVYKDQAGLDTTGYGHLLTEEDKKSKKFVGRLLSEKEATEILRGDVETAEKAVTALIKVSLSQNQFDVLVDFTYNLGKGALSSSTLLKKLNNKDYTSIPEEIRKWNKVRDPKTSELVESKGLTKRREAEAIRWAL